MEIGDSAAGCGDKIISFRDLRRDSVKVVQGRRVCWVSDRGRGALKDGVAF